jgi:hypothetical protein
MIKKKKEKKQQFFKKKDYFNQLKQKATIFYFNPIFALI